MKPTAIIVSDLHLREDTPVCRTDDFWRATVEKLSFLKDLQLKHGVPILCAGDIFHHWKPSPWLLAKAIEHLPHEVITIPGQHDLPNHNLDLYEKCGLNALEVAGRVNTLYGGRKLRIGASTALYGYAWGEDLPENPPGRTKGGGRKVAMIHALSYKKDPEWPGMAADSASKILKKMKGFDLVICGDNHKAFVQTDSKGRIFLSPGSLMRTTTDQEDHQPAAWLWYEGPSDLERVDIPIEDGVITRDHVEKKKSRDERVEAFVEKLGKSFKAGLSFEDNMEQYFKKNKTKKRVKDLVMECIG